MHTVSSLEPLETRIAPAAFITYLDTDGDSVKIVTSKGTAALLTQGAHFTGAMGGPQQLTELDLGPSAIGSAIFAGTTLSITVTHQAAQTGDGSVDVGYINATGIALGTVTVEGDLAKLVVGSSTAATSVLKSLTVNSLAVRGLSTGAPDTGSTIIGPAGTITILGDFDGDLGVNNGASALSGTVASIFIGGSLVGGPADFSGHLQATGLIKSITIKHDLKGGSGQLSGSITGSGGLGDVTIGGSILGGPRLLAGSISTSNGTPIGQVTVALDITGDPGNFSESGLISSSGRLAGLAVGGSLIGGGGTSSGGVIGSLGAGAVSVKGSLQGGAGQDSGTIEVSGGDLTSVRIGGNLLGGDASDAGAILGDGVAIDSVKIGGYLQGGSQAGSGSITSQSIGSVAVKGKLASASTFGASLIGSHARSGGIYVGSGGFGSVTIAGDVLGQIESTGPGTSITLGGSLGVSAADQGFILLGDATGLIQIAHDLSGTITDSHDAALHSLVVGGSLLGGSGGNVNTGSVSLSYANSTIHKASVGGSILGGSDLSSGVLYAFGGLDRVSVRHDLQGGDGSSSGEILTSGKIGSVTIGGSVIGKGQSGQAGENGTITAGSGIDLVSIAHDLQGGAGAESGRVVGGTSGSIKLLTIGGSVLGGGGVASGSIAGFELGALTIAHDLQGGAGESAGSIQGKAGLAFLSISGEVTGAAGEHSGYIGVSNGAIGTVSIRKNLSGGAGQFSGSVIANTTLHALSVGGSVTGGTATDSGFIHTATGSIGSIKIGGDLAGSFFNVAQTTFQDLGAVESGGDITSLKIGGSLRAGVNFDTTGFVRNDGAITALGQIGAIEIKGEVKGVLNVATGGVRNFAFIVAQGSTGHELAIASLTVGGSVTGGLIAAGYTGQGAPANADASLGPITVQGDWQESSAIAGVRNSGGGDNYNFGGVTDVLISGGDAGILASIAAIKISGHVIGSLPAMDHFGFVAEQLTSLKIAGVPVALNPAPHQDSLPVGGTTDVTVHEV